MRLSQYIDHKPKKRKNARGSLASMVASVRAHTAFTPILVVWGALLLGLAVIILPASTTDRMSLVTGLGSLGGFAQWAFAAIAALIGAAGGFCLALILRSGSNGSNGSNIASAVISKRTQPIDPSKELGSESLDAPLEKVPFGADANEIDFGNGNAEQPEDEQPSFTRWDFREALIDTCEAAPAAETAKPVELDLGQFAEAPGRNAVWVEEEETASDHNGPDSEQPHSEQPPAQETSSLPLAAMAPAKALSKAPEPKPVPATGALERLRQKHPEELSLVEMVERFAGALHEHQLSERSRASHDAPMRDVALAEALKALTLFTERGFDQSQAQPGPAKTGADELSRTERELREALGKLQNLRGAA